MSRKIWARGEHHKQLLETLYGEKNIKENRSLEKIVHECQQKRLTIRVNLYRTVLNEHFSYVYISNSSERGIRKLKVKNKISETFRSDDGTDTFFSLHSIVETAAKHKQPIFGYIACHFLMASKQAYLSLKSC